MTATTAPATAEILSRRLADLRAERAEAQAESLVVATGDAVDRAVNVEASIRLQLLDERIAALMTEIEELGRREHTDGVVSVGDLVTLDLGDGPETYLLGSVESVGVAGVDVVTPASPLGRAILGAAVGDTVTYAPRRGVTLSATVVSV